MMVQKGLKHGLGYLNTLYRQGKLKFLTLIGKNLENITNGQRKKIVK